MEQNEEMAMQLWEYIDGNCNETERQRISMLIAQDAQWGQLYTELSSLHTAIPASLELEQPSMRFTRNIMEAVATVQIAPATKKYINKSIIKGIAAFFIGTITILLGYAIAHTDWNTGASSAFRLPQINSSEFFNPTFLYAAAAINIVLALVLLDKLLAKKRSNYSSR